MKEIYSLIAFIIIIIIISSCTKDKLSPTPDTFHNVDVLASEFSPFSLTINVGDTVKWTNSSGFHNVNGTILTFPSNPESFGNAVDQNWTFEYVFNTIGTYNYQCDAHAPMMSGKVIVN